MPANLAPSINSAAINSRQLHKICTQFRWGRWRQNTSPSIHIESEMFSNRFAELHRANWLKRQLNGSGLVSQITFPETLAIAGCIGQSRHSLLRRRTVPGAIHPSIYRLLHDADRLSVNHNQFVCPWESFRRDVGQFFVRPACLGLKMVNSA